MMVLKRLSKNRMAILGLIILLLLIIMGILLILLLHTDMRKWTGRVRFSIQAHSTGLAQIEFGRDISAVLFMEREFLFL